MKPNKKQEVIIAPEPELDKFIPKKKKIDKPWRLEIMITDEETMKRNAWFSNTKKINTWIRDDWEKWVTVKDALRDLNKIGRTYNTNKQEGIKNHWKFAGRVLRLVNIHDDTIIDLEVTDTEVCQKS